ncbi:uncharacterized protein LOC111698383 isoform X2 [Eurytemora carolleeae]|uniref:uncharacterized protein LOC111698383 isoform X2 n=1 Tax=Eurytemora carolleeae TaxID=1294199 RepID=UPI000C774AE2|nr:uncharacterized protein LOC111698383 isoform X2 [Eurytemora carolleeae]|eukprot:XP_023324469.1 uncharacterized protein LOC111698383 isoform X2 [Eurytemora affinis]
MSQNYLSRYPFALKGKYNEIDVLNETLCRNSRAKSEMRERWMTNLDVDTGRYTREFLTPAPHQGMYYPRHELTGYLESASAHIPYLVRPMFNYKTNSKYGYSKYVNVRKL